MTAHNTTLCKQQRFKPASHYRVIGGSATAALVCLGIAGITRIAPASVDENSRVESKSDLIIRRASAAHPKTGWASVIVRLTGKMTPSQASALKGLGADIYRHLPVVDSVALRVPNRNLKGLAALPFVDRLSSDAEVRKNDEFTVGSSGADIAFQQYGLTGKGVTVAVIDSGALLHLDLSDPATKKSRVVCNVNVCSTVKSNMDECGHGTHVMGIVAGNGQSSTGKGYFHTYYGIARQASIVSLRALDSNGRGVVSDVVAAIQWIVNNRKAYNIRVLNLSIGHPVGESYRTDPLCQAAEQAWKAGIVVVCAAGNQGRLSSTLTAGADNDGWGTAYGSIQSPANDPYFITVGATKSINGNRADDRIATYSSRGPTRLDLVLKPDIVAPGNKVISLDTDKSYLDTAYGGTNQIPLSWYCTTTSTSTSNKYFRLSGTSMAAPVVAGAAALMLQANPSLSPDTVKARLMMTADKWTFPDGTGDPCTFGAGYINIPAALACTVNAGQYAMSPSLSQDSYGNVYINIDSALWGAHAIWGTGVNDLRAVWGTNAVWGANNNILNASHAIWGSSVWTDSAVWGTSSGNVDLTSTAIFGE